MAKTTIEWTDKTWNPIRGCTAVSPGCENCYAQREAHRKSGPGGAYEGLTRITEHGPKWTGKVRVVSEKIEEPLHWRKPCKIFVNSMSDIFHKDVSDDDIVKIFDTMRAAYWHQFQVLTKRPERLPEIDKLIGEWPENVLMGVSVENADYLDRIDWLRGCGAVKKFLSLEPLLGPLADLDLTGIDWVIVGGESGPGARPMKEEWARDIRDQCVEQGVAFLFKQWGAFGADGVKRPKKKNGRDLDGRTWDEYPDSSALVPASAGAAVVPASQPESSLMATVEQTLARLDEFTEISDLTELHRQARGLIEYLREHDENGRTMRAAQLRIERRIGEVLAETVRPGNPQLSKTSTIGRLPKGITRDQSSKWQQLAKLPTDVFEKYLGDARKPSLNGALKHALRTAGSDEVGETALYCGRDDLELMIQRGVKFRTIYGDPAWNYVNQGTRAATGNHYRTMPTAEIAALPVEKLAADVSQLHLWTTDAFLADAFEIMAAWGFERKSTLIWEKPQLGLGNHWRVCHEYLLLGTRGGAQFPDGQHGHRSVLRVDREKHSRKPDQFRQLVEQVGNGPRLELFGRRQVAGWTVWGNEVESDKFHQGVGEVLDVEQVEESDEL